MNTEVTMPQMGESVYEGTLTKWLKRVGDPVARDEALFEVSSDKVDSEIPSPASGILSEILVPEGVTIKINTVVARITDSQDKADTAEKPAEVAFRTDNLEKEADVSKPTDVAPSIRPLEIRTSPLVRKLAREHSIDLNALTGTGMQGRITKDDVLAYLSRNGSTEFQTPLENRMQEPVSKDSGSVPMEPLPASTGDAGFSGGAESAPMSPMRKTIAERMVSSKRISAHVNTIFEVDMSAVVAVRESHKLEFQKREGIPLTYTPFFAKALVEGMRNFRIVNASVTGDTILYHKAVNLGIAVALDTGLIVPVVQNAQLKSFTGLALAIHDLAERARRKRLKPSDVQNGTITITNPGVFGSIIGTPIINQPQVAILGIGAIVKRPIIINDAIAIRSIAYLSLSFDHRVIDGAVADQFMADLKRRLESWTQWVE